MEVDIMNHSNSAIRRNPKAKQCPVKLRDDIEFIETDIPGHFKILDKKTGEFVSIEFFTQEIFN